MNTTNEFAFSDSDFAAFERDLLVGREPEIRLFRDLLQGNLPEKRIINLHGTGGVGKSFLLDEYRKIAVENGARFILLDSRDFIHNPESLCVRAVQLLDGAGSYDTGEQVPLPSINECIGRLNRFSQNQRLCLAFDTYEELGALDFWIRDRLAMQLDPSILIVIAGRYPLQGAWKLSPAWRKIVAAVPLKDLDYADVKAYLNKHAIHDDNMILWVWTQTKGHPLTLSLTAQTATVKDLIQVRDIEIFPFITAQWLKELPDPDLRVLVEAASVLRHFNQEILSYVLDKTVTVEEFHRLTALSFVRRVHRGWLLHDLVRTAINQELRVRLPEYHADLWRRCVMYYYQKISQKSDYTGDTNWVVGEAFYYLGDQLIREFFYQGTSLHHFESLDETNYAEAERYVVDRKKNGKEARIPYLDPETNSMKEYIITPEQSLFPIKHVHIKELYELAPQTLRLLRSPSGEVVGLSAVIPIHEGTLDYLLHKPLSSTFFNSLSSDQLSELRVPAASSAGIFIYAIDVLDFEDWALRAAAGLHFISLMLTGGFIAGSPPPLPFFYEVHRRLGCDISEAVHYDFDGVTPAHTISLDTRGYRLKDYLRKTIKRLDIEELLPREPKPELNVSPFTESQKKIAVLLVQGQTNSQIAKQLFISEVTVKKQLTAMFQKVDVKNRTQLVQKILRDD